MTNSRNTIYALLLLIVSSTLTACGQKGPLEVERPPVVQEEVLEETI